MKLICHFSFTKFESGFGSSRCVVGSLAFCTLLAGIVSGQSSQALSQAQDSRQKVPATEVAGAVREEGIPVTDPLVIANSLECDQRIKEIADTARVHAQLRA